ncbi:MAG: isopenicillin N synthase-like dioxygenase [Gammaproteobacteria bacterium]|jgi:isopenicillin N synthase-like dioxygenase
MKLPVIDIADFFDGTPERRQQIGAEIADACENIGFLIISGHGVPADVIDDAFTASGQFFDLPAELKEQSAPATSADARGYHRLASKNLAKTLGFDNPPDLREQFYIGPSQERATEIANFAHAAFLYAPNIWPEQPEQYRSVFTRFFTQMESLAGTLMQIFATGLGLEETYFDNAIDRHFSTVPANDYPPLGYPPLPDQFRCGEHSDFGSLTILAINSGQSGLQVRDAQGQWSDVNTMPGQFVVNIGDMMQRWTNDRWRSTVHRVVNTPPSERSRRMSIGYFLHPNFDAKIECLATCQGPDNPPRYKTVRAGELMLQKMKARAA